MQDLRYTTLTLEWHLRSLQGGISDYETYFCEHYGF